MSIALIGVGKRGIAILNRIYEQYFDFEITYVACDTNEATLQDSPVTKKVLLSMNKANGLTEESVSDFIDCLELNHPVVGYTLSGEITSFPKILLAIFIGGLGGKLDTTYYQSLYPSLNRRIVIPFAL